MSLCFFFQAEDGIRDGHVTGVQTCALPIYETSNSKLINLFNAEIIECPISEVKATIAKKIDELKSDGLTPYFIQGGGHGNIGTKAYVKAYEDIKEYEDNTGEFFEYIFLTSGTGTTQAGLVCGKLINDDNREIVGISNARKNPYGERIVRES